jgi:hypothetical protein
LHIDTPSEYICSDENLGFAVSKLINNLVAVGTFKCTVKGGNFMPLCLHALLDLVGGSAFLSTRLLELLEEEATLC